MIVTNISDNTVTEAARESWLTYWKHFAKRQYCYCSEVNCTEQHEHGVLVKQNSFDSEKFFVVPLCKEHSYGFQHQIEIDESIDVIPAELCL